MSGPDRAARDGRPWPRQSSTHAASRARSNLSGTGSRFTGHYLSDIDNDDGTLTILELTTMGEEIEVYVDQGQLKTDHRFYLGAYKFLTLYYRIERQRDGEAASNRSE